jgi:protein gp37
MGDNSKIEWTDATWNPIRGCTRKSEGCRHCYAERMAARFCDPGQPYHGFAERTPGGGRWTGKVALVPDKIDLPLHWRKPRRVFVNSMGDLFHEALPDADIDRVFAVMALCPQHTFIVATKRSARIRGYCQNTGLYPRVIKIGEIARRIAYDNRIATTEWPWPLPNVWLLVSVENQATAEERIPDLLATPAAVRGVSVEPMIGPMDLYNGDPDPRLGGLQATHTFLGDWWEPGDDGPPRHGVDWVIAGPETGANRRPAQTDWFRSLRDQCIVADVPFFLKAMFVDGRRVGIPELDGRQWAEVPHA